MSEDRGVRLGNETITSVEEGAKIHCRQDWIVAEPLDWEPSKILKVIYRGRALRAKVKAIGPGCYPIRYNGPKGKRTKSWRSTQFLPTELHVGDEIELGGLEIGGYLFTTFRWGSKEHVLCREQDVAVAHLSSLVLEL